MPRTVRKPIVVRVEDICFFACMGREERFDDDYDTTGEMEHGERDLSDIDFFTFPAPRYDLRLGQQPVQQNGNHIGIFPQARFLRVENVPNSFGIYLNAKYCSR